MQVGIGPSFADESGEEQRAFDAGLNAKLQEAGIVPASEPEAEEEQEPEGRPRNPDGTFAAREAEEPEPEPVERPDGEELEPAAAAEPEVDPWDTHLGKYGLDADEFGALPEAAQKAIKGGFEAQRLVGARSDEIAELRALVEERLPADDELDPEWEPPVDQSAAARKIQAHVQKGEFRRAAIEAISAGMDDVFEQVRDAWADERPGEVADFLTDLKMSRAELEWERRLAPFQESQRKQAFDQAWRTVKREDGRSDLDAHAETIIQAAQEFPEALTVLQGGDPAAMTRVLRSLHDMARGRQGASVAAAQPAAAAQVANESAAAKVEAAVASATAVQGRGSAEDAANARIEEARQEFRARLTEDPASVMAGLTRD